jgi:ATP-dependent DNA ligase
MSRTRSGRRFEIRSCPAVCFKLRVQQKEHSRFHRAHAASSHPKAARGKEWQYELKLDGYRALALKSGGKVSLRSRNDNDFNSRYPGIVNALAAMPDDTVIDGEVVALDEQGRPSFNALQNCGSGPSHLHFFIFDILVLDGRDVMGEQLTVRRQLIKQHVLPKLADPIRYSPVLEASLNGLVRSVKQQGLEGLVAKRRDSKYEPGLRSGAWMKMRVNQGQELVIAGYTPSPKNFDALVIGYYEDGKLMYAARTRNGFTPTSWGGVVPEDQTARNHGLPVCESSGTEGRAMGCRLDGSQNA